MQDVFYEETATLQDAVKLSKKFNLYRILSKACYIIFTLYAVFAFLFFVPNSRNVLISVIFTILPAILILAMAIIFGKYKNSIYVEYDYTFISGSIRIAKVIKDIKRRTVIKFDTYNIEKIGYYNSLTYKKYECFAGINKQILTKNLTPLDNKNFYYVVVNVNGQKNLLIIECTQQFIVCILRFSKKSILEEGFLNK